MCLAPGCPRPERRLALALAALLMLAACEPDPTPLPVVPVVTAAAADATAPASARDGVMVDSFTLRWLPAEARERLEAAADVAEVDVLPPATGGPALSALPFEGGTPAGYHLPLAARIDVANVPLNNPQVSLAFTQFLTTRSADALRLALANAGYPDGLTLTVAVDPALWPLLEAGLGGGPIRWFLTPEGTAAQVSLAAGAGADRLLDAGGLLIGQLPIYAAGWTVEVDADGQPSFAPLVPG